MRQLRGVLVWAGLGLIMVIPVLLATLSPYLAYRDAIYITAGFSGIVGLALLVLQPLLVSGVLPGFSAIRSRSWHHWVGSGILVCILVHIGGLYLTSPMDVMDALMLVAPTAFSFYGVAALWASVFIALLVLLRRPLRLRPAVWRVIHGSLTLVLVVGTVVHALMIEGAMEPVSKWALSAVVLMSTLLTLFLVFLATGRCENLSDGLRDSGFEHPNHRGKAVLTPHICSCRQYRNGMAFAILRC